jgi:glycosyltransferase involved in cell wall biosynthesis
LAYFRGIFDESSTVQGDYVGQCQVALKFSIVTISYNQAEFLECAIESVLGQTGTELEYIVVDAGSDDGSRDIIDRYSDRIAHRLYEADDGPADGLNKGCALATGDVIGYLNADDCYEPGAFALVARYLEAHPSVDVVIGHAWLTDRNGKRLRRMWSERFSRRRVAYGASLQIQPSTFIRAEAFRRTAAFNPANRSNWDGELLVDLFLSGAEFGVINRFLSSYRVHGDSITNSGRLQERIDLWTRRCFEKLMGRARTRTDITLMRMAIIARHLSHPRATLERLRYGPVYRRGAK